MKRFFALFSVAVLLLTGMVGSAAALSPDAVLTLVISYDGSGQWEKADMNTLERSINGHRYTVCVNAPKGRVSEIRFRGWFDDLEPDHGEIRYTEAISAFYNFAYVLYDLGIIEDGLDDFPEGISPFTPDCVYERLKNGVDWSWGFARLDNSWENMVIDVGVFEGTNRSTGAYVLMTGSPNSDFEAYIKLP